LVNAQVFHTRDFVRRFPGLWNARRAGMTLRAISKMNDVPERIWKHRFAELLSRRFMRDGVERDAALEDAYAHADDRYPNRSLGSPEREAAFVHEALEEWPA
jgi:hypothetical protein